MTSNSLYGPLADVSGDAGYASHPERVGFFTDTSVCIGCKACEVACKEWNGLPDTDDVLELTGMSYDNTGELGRQQLAARSLHRAAGEQRADHRRR